MRYLAVFYFKASGQRQDKNNPQTLRLVLSPFGVVKPSEGPSSDCLCLIMYFIQMSVALLSCSQSPQVS